jgi:hypothetical protein
MKTTLIKKRNKMPTKCDKNCNIVFHMTNGEHRTNCSFHDSDEAVKIDEAMQLRNELFTLANGFAGDKYGLVAVYLHQACNKILAANQMLNELY